MDMNMQTFEELQRHQLVTEFGIQSQSELEDYQVKLDNVDNPTQAQDNLVVGVDGESLSHWNESVDFDTWVKMNIATSGERGLLIHGNSGLDGVSSITTTMIAGDTFDTDQLGSYWLGDTGLFTVSGGKLTENDDNTWNNIYHQIDLVNSDDWIVYVKTTTPNNIDSWMGVAVMDNAGAVFADNHATTWWQSYGSGVHRFEVTPESSQQTTMADNTEYEIELIKSGTTYATYRDGGLLFDDVVTEFAATYLQIFGFDGGSEINLIYVRKYIATEPTVKIGTPKNISTALKLFGRAG